MKIIISVFKGTIRNVSDGTTNIFDSIEHLSEGFKHPMQGGKHEAYFVRGQLDPVYRKNDNLAEGCLLVIDGDTAPGYEHGCVPPLECHKALKKLGYSHFIYTTHSHEKDCNKFRAVIECYLPDLTYMQSTAMAILADLESIGCDINWVKEMGTWSQAWFLPTRDNPADGLFEYYGWFDGKSYVAANSKNISSKAKEQIQENKETLSLEKQQDDMDSGEHHHQLLIDYVHGLVFDAKGNRSRKALIMDAQNYSLRSPRSDPSWHSESEHKIWLSDHARIPEDIDKMMNQERDERSDEEAYHISDDDIAHDLKRTTFDKKLDHDIFMPNDDFGRLVKAIYKTMWKPNKMIALLAAVGSVAYFSGGKYRGMNRSDTVNVYCLGVGGTGIGKDTLVRTPENIAECVFFDDDNLLDMALAGITSGFGSAESIEDLFIDLGDRPDILYTWDEFGKAMSAFAKNQNDPKSKVMDTLLELWPAAGSRRKKRMLSKDAGKARPIINAPHMNVIGASTESTLVNGIDLNFVSDGHSARMLVMPTNIYMEKPRKAPHDLLLGENIENRFKDMFASNGLDGFDDGGRSRISNPLKIKWDDPVDELIYEIACKEYQDPEGLEAMLRNRDAVNVKKLSMIRAIMCNPINPIVTVEYVNWARKLVKHSGDYQLYLFQGLVGESHADKAEKAVISYLASAHGRWVKQKQLLDLNTIRQMDAPKRIPLLKYMLDDSQTIIRMKRPGRGKPSYVYRLRIDENEPKDSQVDGVISMSDPNKRNKTSKF